MISDVMVRLVGLRVAERIIDLVGATRLLRPTTVGAELAPPGRSDSVGAELAPPDLT
jgi:hypothetical protein